ncbi:MBL fold metallo-hydrolase [Kineococcus aurantiacus]|uniref:Glyoxylase-like metal-dependent hydrolase (Beta-lactamase superfamily II) n=1 Tax=Kineococcus aurantiacus TaxID=37633 RepID=A0A7Y9AR81_9ACTN|nr:MBL fold metallo-hydrolase [Kineococcus aurantiacus]NYD20508.1 glyoxylase-like metal-dependent hydrolase (beta-lactamase superfamily II) [Kineococcus aurantiacus]
MADKITIGEFTVTVLTDGASHLPPSAYPGADFSRYPDVLDATGTHEIRLGAHLVQGPDETFLVDAGAGELSMPFPPELAAADGLTDPPPLLASAGALPAALAAEGVQPEDITKVFTTHLHLDHIGWLVKDGQPFFPNATVYYGAEDWALLVEGAPADDPARIVMETAQEAGVLQTYPAGESELLPGVTAVHAPGHTPGHVTVTLTSQGERLWFVGDLIELPAQLNDEDIHFTTDVDRDTAGSARRRILEQAKEERIVIAASHLSNPSFALITEDDTWADATGR